MGYWRHRVAHDDNGKLHFVWARYEPVDHSRCGMVGIMNEGENIDDMRRLARELLAACDEPIIDLDPYGTEGEPEREEEDMDEGYYGDDR